jgi:3-methylfumaryl-CoA hydratase
MTLLKPKNREDRDAYPSVTRRQVFAEDWMRRIAAMLDLSSADWSLGDPVPFGWHFPLLGAETPRSKLRADGFPGLGLSPPEHGGQRLVALGRKVNALSALHVGQDIERISQTTSIVPKTTSRGPVTLFTVEHCIRDFASKLPIIEETQTFMLLDTPYITAPPNAVQPPAVQPILKTVTPDETFLFQFSALSFNSHKIHLDRDFARTVEGYPDLVVNGGITTLLMTEIARSAFNHHVKRLTVRNHLPLFCNRPIHFAEIDRGEGHCIVAMNDTGHIAVEMEIDINEL